MSCKRNGTRRQQEISDKYGEPSHAWAPGRPGIALMSFLQSWGKAFYGIRQLPKTEPHEPPLKHMVLPMGEWRLIKEDKNQSILHVFEQAQSTLSIVFSYSPYMHTTKL